jgi:glycosyltransferase involved in cell wall biosynthesis
MTSAVSTWAPTTGPVSSRFADGESGRERVRVMLLISSLEYGGAERQVVELANQLDENRFEVTVCSLSEEVPLAAALRDREARLQIVPRRSRRDWGVILRTAKLMRARQIDLVHAFLFDAEMVARAAARWAGVSAVIASERNTDYRRPMMHSIGMRLTRNWFDALIANSEAGKRFSIRTLGLSESRVHVIRNGVDIMKFRPTDGMAVRRELGIPFTAPLVGMVASFKRQKRHGDFFRMARLILQRIPEAWFLCVGEPLRDNLQGAEDYHREMRELVASLGIRHRIRFAGSRNDMPEVYSACQVTVLTSSREGTPNVLLESMACAVPIVATDVADNIHLVPGGDVGSIVGVGEVEVMADRVWRLLADPLKRKERGRAARDWVVREFSTATLARKTEAVYLSILAGKKR